jgi:hypothetical protein
MKRALLLLVTLAVLAVTAGVAMAECGADHGKTAESGSTKTGG